jgi:flagellar hook assembly protein FlgD
VWTNVTSVQSQDESGTTEIGLCNYPNPLNAATRIRYEIPADAHISLRIMDVTGRIVRNLYAGKQKSGIHEILWDGRSNAGIELASGVYYLTLNLNNQFYTARMTVIR